MTSAGRAPGEVDRNRRAAGAMLRLRGRPVRIKFRGYRVRVRVASAGTGKTTSLVLRYLELIGAGTPLRRIAGVTFTRTAAGELRQRVGSAVRTMLEDGEFLHLTLAPEQRPSFEEAARELDGATLTTIHGFMIEALRLAAPTMGLDPDFGPVPEWEGQALFEEELRSLLLLANDPQHPLNPVVAPLGGRPEEGLLALFGKRSLVERFTPDEEERSRALVELFEASYEAYERRLGPRSLAPGEIERRALRMTRVPAAMNRLRSRFRVVLVDEYQDVNPTQGRYFEAIEAAGVELEVVGDPKQSIYGFRNADVGVFRRALEQGEELPALTRSYRHGKLVNRFLNKLTATLAERKLGFSAREAPPVEPAGEAAAVRGRIEIHWVAGNEPVAQLRGTEAEVLAERLRVLHEELGIPYSEMAVLARSHPSLAVAEEALERAGLPAVLLQGRGYYERSEIRDIYNALRAGIEPSGVPFAAWLRGPFGRLAPIDLVTVLSAADPLSELERVDAGAAGRYDQLRELLLRPPLEALKALVREPLIDGRSLVHFLDERQRENVDALLFTVARQPPSEIQVLLERLELLGRQSDAGDVPQTGDGIKLLTVHAAKGLEWRVAAVFDLGRGAPPNRDTLRVDPENGVVSFPGSPRFEEAGRKLAEREEAESYRLLYVAASRPREMLILSGTAKGGRCVGWARALELMTLGPQAKQQERSDFLLATHAAGSAGVSQTENGSRTAQAKEAAPWLEASFPLHPYPPVFSPSRLERAEYPQPNEAARPEGEPATQPGGDFDEEPLRPGGAEEVLPGRASAVGTLVHYAISQSWRPDEAGHIENLRAQEVMFPFSSEEQESMLTQVAELLTNYWSLIGVELPALEARDEDEAELAIALPHGATVWQGVIDRLYRVGERWFIDDYKTDKTVNPRLYHAQLSIYRRTVREARGIDATARLVYLRPGTVVELAAAELELAFGAAMDAASGTAAG